MSPLILLLCLPVQGRGARAEGPTSGSARREDVAGPASDAMLDTPASPLDTSTALQGGFMMQGRRAASPGPANRPRRRSQPA